MSNWVARVIGDELTLFPDNVALSSDRVLSRRFSACLPTTLGDLQPKLEEAGAQR